MCSGMGDTTQLVPGFPIRTPWDHSLVDSSPRPIAASHVLHRLLVPRHPPFALSNLTTKMLASTIQFSTNTQTPHTRHHQHPKTLGAGLIAAWACHLKEPPPEVVVFSEPQQGAATQPTNRTPRSPPEPGGTRGRSS